MRTWVKTYLVVALCMIGAGIIYLSLPLGQEEENKADMSNGIRQEAEGIDELGERDLEYAVDEIEIAQPDAPKLYRLENGRLETSAGYFEVAQEAQWYWGETLVEGSKARFLGQALTLTQDDTGLVTQIQVRSPSDAPSRIRILLQAGDGAVSSETDIEALKADYIYETVTIRCEEAFWGIWDGSVKAYTPGTAVTIDGLAQRVVFCPVQSDTPLVLQAGDQTQSYYGQLEVGVEEGGYSVVNEVNIEKYLMGVVPSEMPGSYGEEAAKVQAVCARSYAYSQWFAGEKFLSLGAHVDDSTRSQVYGGVVDYEASIQGVEATWGQVLTYQGSLISANYFSTSCGYTANGHEVWAGHTELPYQMGQPQYEEGDYGDLSQEENFHAFITNGDVAAYDSESPWFRWQASIDLAKLQDNVDAYFALPKEVKEVQGEELIEAEINGIGQVQDIYVYERSQTGMAISLLLMGSERSVVLEGPLKIRELLGGLDVTMANGEQSGERVLLPSAFISLEKIKDTEENLVSVTICGGGYGHGVGMSQNGVKGMIEAGYTYDQILQHFYPGTELVNF